MNLTLFRNIWWLKKTPEKDWMKTRHEESAWLILLLNRKFVGVLFSHHSIHKFCLDLKVHHSQASKPWVMFTTVLCLRTCELSSISLPITKYSFCKTCMYRYCLLIEFMHFHIFVHSLALSIKSLINSSCEREPSKYPVTNHKSIQRRN